MSFTPDNAVDLHNVSRFPQYCQLSGKKHTDPVKNTILCHCTAILQVAVFC
jgi:hypothetical protein